MGMRCQPWLSYADQLRIAGMNSWRRILQLSCRTLLSWQPPTEINLTKPNAMTLKNSNEWTDGGLPTTTCSASFVEFPKMARLSRECIVTEKIDGTNAQLLIAELANDEPIPAHSLGVFDHDGKLHYMAAGSRTRWITPEVDNAGFAAWVARNFDQLKTLGPGRHFGEWWGQGIQRKYGMTEKRWSLFNVARWCFHGEKPDTIATADPRIVKTQDMLPPCCHLVPILYRGNFCTVEVDLAIVELASTGSKAAPGYMKPEGIVVFHVAGNVGFKKTLEKDDVPKGQFLR